MKSPNDLGEYSLTETKNILLIFGDNDSGYPQNNNFFGNFSVIRKFISIYQKCFGPMLFGWPECYFFAFKLIASIKKMREWEERVSLYQESERGLSAAESAADAPRAEKEKNTKQEEKVNHKKKEF